MRDIEGCCSSHIIEISLHTLAKFLGGIMHLTVTVTAFTAHGSVARGLSVLALSDTRLS